MGSVLKLYWTLIYEWISGFFALNVRKSKAILCKKNYFFVKKYLKAQFKIFKIFKPCEETEFFGNE